MIAARTGALADRICVSLCCKGHVLIAFRDGIAEVRHLAHDELAQILISFPVVHDRIVQLAGGSKFLLEADLVDDVQRVCYIADADAGAASGVEHRAAPHNILAGFHASGHGSRDHRKRRMECRDGFPGIGAVCVPDHPVIKLFLYSTEDFVHRVHLVQVTSLWSLDLFIGRRSFWMERVDAVIDSHQHGCGDIDIGLCAVAARLCPFIAAHTWLHAADQAVVAGIFQRDPAAHQCRDDRLVTLKGRDAANDFCRLDGCFPKFFRRARMDTQRLRNDQFQPCAGLQEHIGHIVGRVAAFHIYAAQSHQRAAGVSRAGSGCFFIPEFIKFHEFEEEQIYQFLSFFRRDAAGLEIFLIVAAQILVYAAEADAMQLCIQAHSQQIHPCALQRVIERAARILHDPVQGIRHTFQFFFAYRICTFISQTLCFRCVAFGPDDDAVGDDLHCTIKVILVDVLARDAIFFVCFQFCACLIADGAEALACRRPEVGVEVANRSLRIFRSIEIDHAAFIQLIHQRTRIVFVNDGAHVVLQPEIACFQQVFFIFFVQLVRVHTAGTEIVCTQFFHEPGPGYFRIQGAGAVLYALPADDELIIVNGDRQFFKQVAQILCTLQDAGQLRVIHIKFSHQPVAADIDRRFCAAAFLADGLHTFRHRASLIHMISSNLKHKNSNHYHFMV